MAASFPKGYKCSPVINEMYPDIERQMMPLIKAKVARLRRFTKLVDPDDAIQEGRLALLVALSRFDYNKCSGELERYVGRVLTYKYQGMMYEMLAQSRMPHVIIKDEEGEWVKVPRAPMTLDDLLGCEPTEEAYDAEEKMHATELEERARLFRLKMMMMLKDSCQRDYEVFMCKVNPPIALLKMVSNTGGDVNAPTNLDIAKHLGLSKNAVDWSLLKIRRLFTDLAKDDDFSDLFGDALERKGCPVIHHSMEPRHDVQFVQRTIAKRKLDPRPLPDYASRDDYAQKAGCFHRLIERYPWGVVMVLKNEQQTVTMVIEGKLNPRTGEVFGEGGLRGHVDSVVSWYGALVKALLQGGE